MAATPSSSPTYASAVQPRHARSLARSGRNPHHTVLTASVPAAWMDGGGTNAACLAPAWHRSRGRTNLRRAAAARAGGVATGLWRGGTPR